VFHGRAEIRDDAGLVAPRVYPIPTVSLQINRDQAVQAKGASFAIERQPLVTQRCWNPASAQQGNEQVALRITKAHPLLQHIRGSASDSRQTAIRTVPHGIPHPKKTLARDLFISVRIPRNIRRSRHDGGRRAVDNGSGLEEFVQVKQWLKVFVSESVEGERGVILYDKLTVSVSDSPTL